MRGLPLTESCKDRRKRRARPATLWYARYHFWHEAARLDTPQRRLQHGGPINDLIDLTEQERKVCLQRVHAHFAKHQHLAWHGGRGRGFVEKGMGPSNDADVSDPAFDHNGSNPCGGRVFKWYRKAVFQDKLRALGWSDAVADGQAGQGVDL